MWQSFIISLLNTINITRFCDLAASRLETYTVREETKCYRQSYIESFWLSGSTTLRQASANSTNIGSCIAFCIISSALSELSMETSKFLRWLFVRSLPTSSSVSGNKWEYKFKQKCLFSASYRSVRFHPINKSH